MSAGGRWVPMRDAQGFHDVGAACKFAEGLQRVSNALIVEVEMKRRGDAI
jgi:hypothetical protein